MFAVNTIHVGVLSLKGVCSAFYPFKDALEVPTSKVSKVYNP